MKNILFGLALLAFIITGCEKKVDPVDGSNVTVTLQDAGKNFVTGDVTLNPKDSIFFSFTITSSRDMKYVSVQKNPVNQTAFLKRDTLTAANKNEYSTVMKFMADSANGSYLYRIVAHDATGNYIGHKDITVNITPDFNYYTYRFLYVPDTVAKVNKCYFSTNGGNTYSYSDGAANSANIDFGYFYDTTKVSGSPLGHTVYALGASTFAPYDISTWTKNATVFKKISTPAFNTFTSSGGLRTAGISNLASGAVAKVTGLSASSPNNMVVFKTAAGKYGVLLINFVNGSDGTSSTYVNVDVKVQK
jgi:hypothetical protein